MNAQELLDKIKDLPHKPIDVPTAPPIELVAMVVRWGRHLKQWKATTLADFSRVSLSTVERVERAERVSDDALDRIAQALGHERGAFTTPRLPIGQHKAAEQLIETYGHLEPVAVAPMKTKRPSVTRPNAMPTSSIARACQIRMMTISPTSANGSISPRSSSPMSSIVPCPQNEAAANSIAIF